MARIRINITIDEKTNERADKVVKQLKKTGDLKSTEGKSTLIQFLLDGFIDRHDQAMLKKEGGKEQE